MSKKILVLNGASYAEAIEGLGAIEFSKESFITNPTSFGLVLFTGGEDITPEWYGETSPQRMCYYNTSRDKTEKNIFTLAVKNKVRCIGICRGVQFLNVVAGGKMYHDVDNHAGKHHDITTVNGEVIRVNSLHHQMLIPPKYSQIIAWASKREATRYYGNEDKLVQGPIKEPEAILLPNIESGGAQWHPEMMPELSKGREWFYNLAKDFLTIKDFSEIVKKYTEVKCFQEQKSVMQ